MVFSSQTRFGLPGEGDRAPDVAWVALDRWQPLSQEERERFPLICFRDLLHPCSLLTLR
ncbi:hypothetical protein J5X98_27245 [Leptothermofonsia sichuanensis E412]|uniref:Uma2 family endonuclease n=1 Tax=Leptothermofonsia sichuanensis TaxID=2917832 RepID=UPI001CA6AEFE|nr:hypothetical protein J5X98_27245 [Leptothermofonsia sichuanensis E412]